MVDIKKAICPECKNEFEGDYDEDREVYCEECGTHSAIECPICGELIDLVYYEI